MKQSVAISHLRAMMLAIQRLRSINAENGVIEIGDPIAAKMWPLLYDPKRSVLPILTKILDRVDETGELSPTDYYNLVTVATQIEPLIGVAASVYGDGVAYPDSPNVEWLRGWETE